MADLAVRLLRDGYTAIEQEREARGAGSGFAARMLGRRAVVLARTGA